MAKHILLTGRDLTSEDLGRLISNPRIKIEILPACLRAVKRSHNFLLVELTRNNKVIYGINTGFGPMASHILGSKHLLQLQENLIRSHAVGMGDLIEEKYGLAAMVVRLNTLIKGYSGVSVELVERLKSFINLRIIPQIPEHGAVGTSGDLVQLAHIGLALTGEGQVLFKGQIIPASQALQKLKLPIYRFQPKEGLALINGTSFMTAVAALNCVEANRLLNLSIVLGAFALEIVQGFSDGISDRLNRLRPHAGQVIVAQRLRQLLASSKLLRERRTFERRYKSQADVHQIPEIVQEVYSLRCIPQILGPVYDAFTKTSREVAIEMNAVTDNPIIDPFKKNFWHGGNFHGDYIAAASDHLKLTLVKLTMLSERRINFFLNSSINKFLPPFLNLKKPGLHLALQGLQFVATSTVAQSQSLAFPHYVHSIPTNSDNQDVVSMGADAALLTSKVTKNAFVVSAIEAIVLSQAIDYLKEVGKLSKSSKKIYQEVRRILPTIVEDRVLVEQLPRVLDLIETKLSFEWK